MENDIKIIKVAIDILKPAEYNPRKNTEKQQKDLEESLKRFGLIDPFIVNSAPARKDIIIGGHFRWRTAKKLGFTEAPVVYVNIPDLEKEKELNLRLNKNTGEWDWDLLADFEESVLSNVGFSSEDLDTIFETEEVIEQFDLQKELAKLDITKINIQKGDIYALGDHRLMCGDSTDELSVITLMNGQKAVLCLTDPPYILNYLQGKQRHGDPTVGFGAKKNRRYLETDILPPDFTEKWMANVHKIQANDFSIIVYENWKNLRTIWGEMEKYWKVKNMIVWHLPNRHQGFSAKYKFFSKHDIAMVGVSPDATIEYNHEQEKDGLQEEYETALYAISGKPNWEGYQKGKKNQPTDFIEYVASDEKHSGQGVIFGTKPIEILIPYIKMLTKRDDVIIETFGGSGSTLMASEKMKRRCYLMEKSPTYAEVIKKRWEKLTGKKGVQIACGIPLKKDSEEKKSD